MNELYLFYNYHFRKDLIDKLNICSVFDLQLPLGIQISKRIHFAASARKRRRKLLSSRARFETVTGFSCAIRRIRRSSRVKRGVKINKRHHFYDLFCDLLHTRSVFNFLIRLYTIIQFHQNSNFYFRFKRKTISKHKGKGVRRVGLLSHEFCVLRKLRERSIFFLPKHVKSKKKKFRISFFNKDKSNTLIKHRRLLLRLFFKRLKIIKTFIVKKEVEIQIIK